MVKGTIAFEKEGVDPYIVDETPAYLVVYKPPRMHTVPLKDRGGKTLLDWCTGIFPRIRTVEGKNLWEGGILHRLDYETQGLVLAAKTQTALNLLYIQQEQGLFIKTYGALSVPQKARLLPGFPPAPRLTKFPCTLESAFRSFGPGQRAVRPVAVSPQEYPCRKKLVLDRGKPYCTEIVERHDLTDSIYFHVQIRRGFRHQIRCHLAWLGFPLAHDVLYGGAAEDDRNTVLALIAQGISFYDPLSEQPRQYAIPGFLSSRKSGRTGID